MPWRGSRPGRLRAARSVGVVMAGLGLAGPVASAQSVEGVLLLSGINEPAARAYVVLLDEDSVEVTRALTNPLGEFTIHAPRPGTFRLRIERIGFRSFVSQPFQLTSDAITELRLVVEPAIVRLDPFTIEGGGDCRVIGEQAMQVLTVWEEARKVLTAVAWSDPQGQLIHEMERFERWYTPRFDMVHEERSTIPTRQVMPFRSRSVEELEESGYVILEEDSVVYEAPDAEVFFSPPFLQHHCFQLDRRREGGRSMVGLRFEPVPGRTLPDVKGVFWLDAASAALQRLELQYVNVGVWQHERGAASELAFEQLPDGRWFVSSWWIRMPLVRRVESMKGPVWHFPEAVVGFEQEGGEVVRVYAADGRTLFARGRATVAGVVFDSTSGAGLEGAFVRLRGTNRITITEADGSYWLPDLPEGRYTVTFSHPRAALLGLGELPDAETVELRIGTVSSADLAVPSPNTIAARHCTDAAASNHGLLAGRVSAYGSDSALAGARVRVVWLEMDDRGTTPAWRETATDSSGTYRVCAPRATAMSVEVSADSLPFTAVPTVFPERAFHLLDVEVREPDPVPDGGRGRALGKE